MWCVFVNYLANCRLLVQKLSLNKDALIDLKKQRHF